METVDFLKELEISYLHIFTYSERANTTAIKLGDPVPMNIRKQRSQQLHILSNKKKRAFYEENVGRIEVVLFENENNDGYMFGFTSNYVKIKTPYNEKLTNTFQRISMDEIDRDGLMKCTLLETVIA